MDHIDNTIIKLIYEQVYKIRDNGFEPRVIILNEVGYRELIQNRRICTELKKLDNMMIILDPDSEVCVKVLCNPIVEFQHLGEIGK